MKTKVLVSLFVICCASYTAAQIVPGSPASYPSVSIVNTPHNLNNYPGIHIEGNQVCLPCHTPHNAKTSSQLLWNHAETEQTFTMYKNTAGQPSGTSKLCLSCHDGVTALDSYGDNVGSVVVTGSHNIGTDLTNDHPIGIAYPTNRPTSFRDPSTFAPGINGRPIKLVTTDGIAKVECSSCHNVHNNGLGDFLRVPIQESYLCLQCHIK